MRGGTASDISSGTAGIPESDIKVHFTISLSSRSPLIENQRDQDTFVMDLLKEFSYHNLYNSRDMRQRDILEMVRFEAKTHEVKLGFKYDHVAYAVLDLDS